MRESEVLQRIAELGDFKIEPSLEHPGLWAIHAGGSAYYVDTFFPEQLMNAYVELRVRKEVASRDGSQGCAE